MCFASHILLFLNSSLKPKDVCIWHPPIQFQEREVVDLKVHPLLPYFNNLSSKDLNYPTTSIKDTNTTLQLWWFLSTHNHKGKRKEDYALIHAIRAYPLLS